MFWIPIVHSMGHNPPFINLREYRRPGQAILSEWHLSEERNRKGSPKKTHHCGSSIGDLILVFSISGKCSFFIVLLDSHSPTFSSSGRPRMLFPLSYNGHYLAARAVLPHLLCRWRWWRQVHSIERINGSFRLYKMMGSLESLIDKYSGGLWNTFVYST